METKQLKIYAAGPWFTDAQSEREIRIKTKLRELGFNVFSPREESNITGTIASKQDQKNTFMANIQNIDDCDIIFAICDGKQCEVTEPDQLGRKYNAIDSGTMIECGYAYALRTKVKQNSPIIIYYAETLGNSAFNLMLAQSADAVITSFEDLDNLHEIIDNARNNIRKEFDGEIE